MQGGFSSILFPDMTVTIGSYPDHFLDGDYTLYTCSVSSVVNTKFESICGITFIYQHRKSLIIKSVLFSFLVDPNNNKGDYNFQIL